MNTFNPIAMELTGGVVSVKAFLGTFPVYSGNLDLCSLTKHTNMTCPIQPGEYSSTIQKFIPKTAPSVSTLMKHLNVISYHSSCTPYHSSCTPIHAIPLLMHTYIHTPLLMHTYSYLTTQGHYSGRAVAFDQYSEVIACIEISFSL